MKYLLLLRHAKSDWDDPTLTDSERPLSPRGERDAPRIGEALREHTPLPDLVFCSTAVRARQTIAAVAPAAELTVEPIFKPEMYGASVEELLSLVREIPMEHSTVLLVGHNPGFEELLAHLTGQLEAMPTAALACIAFEIARWEEVRSGKGKLKWFVTPKQL